MPSWRVSFDTVLQRVGRHSACRWGMSESDFTLILDVEPSGVTCLRRAEWQTEDWCISECGSRASLEIVTDGLATFERSFAAYIESRATEDLYEFVSSPAILYDDAPIPPSLPPTPLDIYSLTLTADVNGPSGGVSNVAVEVNSEEFGFVDRALCAAP